MAGCGITLVIPATERLNQENYKFMASLYTLAMESRAILTVMAKVHERETHFPLGLGHEEFDHASVRIQTTQNGLFIGEGSGRGRTGR